MKYKILSKQNNTDKCFVCGMLNDAGTKAMFYNCENENGEKVLLTIIEPQTIHQSYPNRMHGGIISALLDESMGRSIQSEHPEVWAVTIDLNVRYRKSTPLDQTLYIESHVTSLGPKAYDSEGKLFLKDGTICATAKGKFYIVPYEKLFNDAKLDDNSWFLVKEDLTAYIEI